MLELHIKNTLCADFIKKRQAITLPPTQRQNRRLNNLPDNILNTLHNYL